MGEISVYLLCTVMVSICLYNLFFNRQVHEYASKGEKVMGELEADFQQLERDMAEEFGHSLSEESGKCP